MRVLVVVATKYRWCIVSTKKITKSELRFVKKQDVSSLVYYLPTDEASQVTGSNLRIDGGWPAQ